MSDAREEVPVLPVDVPRRSLRSLAVEVSPPLHEIRVREAVLLREQFTEEARSEAPLPVLFPEAFLAHHAGVPDLRALFTRAGLPPENDVDRDFLRALGKGTLDAVAREHTEFATWDEFESAARRAYVARRLLDFTL